ncbi:protein disulfide-isomerase A1 [Paragonimus westermani]|uniref:Protein disulfide-isomerase n=1 Tax=Paragonimus westermani TaxID=34504 RepID=A0A5J4NG44_9TREM|nr:protein disulfide-isomerase A1 [Paragonimus westermani]
MAMRLLALLFGLLSVTSGESEFREENNVAVLTKDNFESACNKYKFCLVEFYAPWCGHCKALKPEYEKAAEILKTEAPDVLLAKVDATVETDLAQEHGVTGYPTLKFLKNGEWVDYSGGRKADGIVTWVKRKTQPSLQEITTLVDFDPFINSSDVVVVGFFKDKASDARAHLEKAADVLDKYPFALTFSQEILDKYGVENDVQVTVFKSFDEGRSHYEGELDSEKIVEFVRRESIPLVVDFSQESAGNVFGSSIRIHVVAFAQKSVDYDKIKTEITPVARTFKGKAHFLIIDTDLEDHHRILDFFGMSKSDVPSYRIINLSDDMIKYKPDTSDFSEPSMTSFIKEVLEGTRKPFLMSQEIPPESNEPVRVLVGKNYNEVTQDDSKAIFVELYAPWCGHCQQLAPIWTQLGETYKDEDDIIIAKMDATANEAEGLRVNSFPTLKYYPKGSKTAIDYSGERTLEALKKFVDSEGKVSAEDKPPKEEPKDEL